MNWLKKLKDWWNYVPSENKYPEIAKNIIFMISKDSKFDFIEIKPETTFKQLSFDYLDMVDLIMDLEDFYDISIKEDIITINSILDLSNYIGELNGKN